MSSIGYGRQAGVILRFVLELYRNMTEEEGETFWRKYQRERGEKAGTLDR
jgi:hypothetical protein